MTEQPQLKAILLLALEGFHCNELCYTSLCIMPISGRSQAVIILLVIYVKGYMRKGQREWDRHLEENLKCTKLLTVSGEKFSR